MGTEFCSNMFVYMYLFLIYFCNVLQWSLFNIRSFFNSVQINFLFVASIYFSHFLHTRKYFPFSRFWVAAARLPNFYFFYWIKKYCIKISKNSIIIIEHMKHILIINLLTNVINLYRKMFGLQKKNSLEKKNGKSITPT